jgi:hypothetical protein
MRSALALIPLAILAAPAAAAPPPQVPPQLTDPATIDRVTDAMQAVSRAFMDLPVGEVEAALEGRPPTPADHARTLRSEDPNLDRKVQEQVAQARPMIHQGMNAMATALPEVMKSLHDAKKSVERAMANMPDPNYPKR